jgi:hypothetical protein
MFDEPALRPATPRVLHSVFAVTHFAKIVKQAGVPLAERGWGEPSNMLEPPLGGGAGERCVKACRPQDGA